MSAFLFTAGVTQSQMRLARGPGQTGETLQMWETCLSAIVFGGELEQAQAAFEAWCVQSPEGEKPIETKIKKLVAAEFLQQMLTETGNQPLDWPRIPQKVEDMVSAHAVDDFEQGYWVEVNTAVPAGITCESIPALQQNVPEEIGSGLNWSHDKQFLFVLTVLSLHSPELEERFDLEETDDSVLQDENDLEPDLDRGTAILPELRDKEAAALIEARNSVVAAWLWRRFAATTALAQNEIRIREVGALLPAMNT